MDDLPPISLSPSLQQRGEGPAYELKYVLGPEAQQVEAWARQHLLPDPHGVDGTYHTTSLYCDTAALDVFYRRPGHRRIKYRLRRYESGNLIHLERKRRQGDQVRKRRELLPLDQLALLQREPDTIPEQLPFAWFLHALRRRQLQPTARVAYSRTAFHGPGIRLTIDRHLRGERATDWDLTPLTAGRPLLQGHAVLELKFAGLLPGLFRDLLATLPGQLPSGVSKYRLCLRAEGISECPIG
ncbi:MAG: polyphosphate polymerase domain-containing protein [Gemmataceae bacterium]